MTDKHPKRPRKSPTGSLNRLTGNRIARKSGLTGGLPRLVQGPSGWHRRARFP